MEESSNNDSNSNTGIDRVQLKEERRIRNKQKKLAKQLESQRKREQANLLKLQPKSNYLTLLTQDDAKRIVGNIPLRSSNHEFSVSERDFPSLEETGRINVHKSGSNQVVHLEPSGKSLAKINVELADLLNRPSALTIPHKSVPVRCTSTASYGGNSLDSDMPVRSRGKVREEPKEKKPTLLKQKILQDKSENVDLKENPFESNLPYEFEESTKVFIKNLVELQQKLYKRNPIKGAYKKRYVVGLHEVKKCLQLNRVKILFFATDIQITKENDTLSCVINELIEKAKSNNVPYAFILRRRQLGKLTLKFIPVSCMAVLNYEGLEAQFNEIAEQIRIEDEKIEPDQDEITTKLLDRFRLALTCD